MLSVICDKNSDPETSLRIAESPEPVPGPGEVVIKMLASAVSPADLASIRGAYRTPVHCPGTPGLEGMGVVAKVGAGVLIFKEGDRVIYEPPHLLNKFLKNGAWTEYLKAPEVEFQPLPDDFPADQGAQFYNSLLTPWVMLQDILQVKKDEVVLVTAAGSTVGRVILKMAKILGFKVIGVVRRAEQMDEILKLGAIEVINSSTEDVVSRAMNITQLNGVNCAIDSVGGGMVEKCFRSLGDTGRMINFGLFELVKEAKIDLRKLLYYQNQISGFWMPAWMHHNERAVRNRRISEVIELVTSGDVLADVEKTYPLTEVKKAMAHLVSPGNKGKIILDCENTK